MKDEERIREAKKLASIMYDRLEENEHHMEAVGVGVIEKALEWVLEEDEHDTLLQDLRKDVKESEDGDIDL